MTKPLSMVSHKDYNLNANERENSSRKSERNNYFKIIDKAKQQEKIMEDVKSPPPTNFVEEVDSGSGNRPSTKSIFFGPD